MTRHPSGLRPAFLRLLIAPLALGAVLLLHMDNAAWAQSALPASPAPAAKPGTAELPERLTKAQVDDLVARLSDEEVRDLLIRQLDKVATEEQAPNERRTVMHRFMTGLTNAEINIGQTIDALQTVPSMPGLMVTRLTGDTNATAWGVLFLLLLFFGIGIAAERLFRRAMPNVGEQPAPESPLDFRVKFKAGLLRLIIDFIAVAVFAIAAVITSLILDLPTDAAEALFTTVLSATVVYRLVAAGLRFVLAPKARWMRLVNLEDALARDAYGKLLLVSGMLIYLIWMLREVMADFGFAKAQGAAVTVSASVVFIAVLVFIIWQLRPAPVASDAGPAAGSPDYFARNWHIMAILGVLFFYLLALAVSFATGARVLEPFISSLVVLGFVPIIDSALRGWVARLTAPDRDRDAHPTQAALAEAPETPAPSESEESTAPAAAAEGEAVAAASVPAAVPKQSYDAVIISNLRILLALLAIFALAGIWNLNLFGFLEALVGERAARVLVNISVTGLLAYAVWGVVSTAVARITGPGPAAGEVHLEGEGGGGSGSRLGTVLPLFKKFLFITLIVMFVLIVLSSLGVNIGPLIAGAGIIGIAIGFGAQTLVRDIVSGLFFLLDDAFRVGEYVNIGDTRGTVEKISVRSLRLRHHNGPLHTVPFGEIKTLTNWSRDWAIMKFEIRVPFETDVDMVRRLIKKVGQEMLEDEELGPLFLDPLKSQGVNRMDDSSFIIRCKFTTVPGNQFFVRREAYARIQRAFEAKGIKFAPRRVVVQTTGTAAPEAVKAAAAAGALDAPDARQEQVKDEPG